MVSKNGRFRRRQRLRAVAPHGNWKTTAFLAGVRTAAYMVLYGPISRNVLFANVEQVLVSEPSPGHIVVMEILFCHKAPAIREAVEAASAELRLLE